MTQARALVLVGGVCLGQTLQESTAAKPRQGDQPNTGAAAPSGKAPVRRLGPIRGRISCQQLVMAPGGEW